MQKALQANLIFLSGFLYQQTLTSDLGQSRCGYIKLFFPATLRQVNVPHSLAFQPLITSYIYQYNFQLRFAPPFFLGFGITSGQWLRYRGRDKIAIRDGFQHSQTEFTAQYSVRCVMVRLIFFNIRRSPLPHLLYKKMLNTHKHTNVYTYFFIVQHFIAHQLNIYFRCGCVFHFALWQCQTRLTL